MQRSVCLKGLLLSRERLAAVSPSLVFPSHRAVLKNSNSHSNGRYTLHEGAHGQGVVVLVNAVDCVSGRSCKRMPVRAG